VVALDIDDMLAFAGQFAPKLQEMKRALEPEGFWYPFGTIANIGNFDKLLTGESRDLLKLVDGRPVADIGGADGDMSFLLEAFGCDVDLVDFAQTNRNRLWGATRLMRSMGSKVNICDVDLNHQFQLPRTYGLALFLGILYHLKNPYGALETLARSARHAIISTRVAQVTPDKSLRFADAPLAYLLADRECANDPTNYWIFSAASLRRLLERTGWEVLDWTQVGCETDSDPATWEGDERVFTLVRSTVFDR
jgi:hypothetical protein